MTTMPTTMTMPTVMTHDPNTPLGVVFKGEPLTKVEKVDPKVFMKNALAISALLNVCRKYPNMEEFISVLMDSLIEVPFSYVQESHTYKKKIPVPVMVSVVDGYISELLELPSGVEHVTYYQLRWKDVMKEKSYDDNVIADMKNILIAFYECYRIISDPAHKMYYYIVISALLHLLIGFFDHVADVTCVAKNCYLAYIRGYEANYKKPYDKADSISKTLEHISEANFNERRCNIDKPSMLEHVEDYLEKFISQYSESLKFMNTVKRNMDAFELIASMFGSKVSTVNIDSDPIYIMFTNELVNIILMYTNYIPWEITDIDIQEPNELSASDFGLPGIIKISSD